jgi:tetratricopeptide (TPR) repeat protein
LIDNKDSNLHCYRIGLVGPFNNLAWDPVRRPPARTHDAELAIQLARKTVEWEPAQAGYWNTLGVAHYRAGDWPAAAGALERSIALGRGGTASDWFLAACVNHRQGQFDEARRSYDRGAAWLLAHRPSDQAMAAEFGGFHDEAGRLLGLTEEQRASTKAVASSR